MAYEGMSAQEVLQAQQAIQQQLTAGTLSQEQAQTALAGLPKINTGAQQSGFGGPGGTTSLARPTITAPAPNPTPWQNMQAATQAVNNTPANTNGQPQAANTNAQGAANGQPAPAPGQAQGAPQIDPRDQALMNLQRGAAVAPRPGGLTKLDKNYLEDLVSRTGSYANILDNAVNAQNDARNAFVDNSRAVADAAAYARQDFQASQLQEQKQRQALASEMQERDRAINSQIADLQAQGIDPNRYWNNQSTAGKVAGFIAAGLSSFAAYGLGPRGVQHQNVAIDMLNDQINRDVDAQKSNLMKNLDLVKTKHSLNSQYFDEQSALLKAERDSYMSAYNVTIEQVKQQAAQYKDNNDVQTNAAKMIAGLQLNKQEKIDGLHDQIYGIMKRNELAQGSNAGAYQKRLDAIRATAKQMVLDSKGQVGEDEALRRATALELLSGSPAGSKQTTWQEGNKAQTQQQTEDLNNLDNAIKGVQELQDLRSKHGGGSIDSEARAAAASKATLLKGLIGHSIGGRFTEKELDAMNSMIPEQPLEHNVSGIIGRDPTMAQLKAVETMLSERRALFARNPQQTAANYDPNNQLGFAKRQ